MRYLTLNRSNGGKHVCAILVEKAVRYGNRSSTTCVTKTKNVLIVGAHNSGKSRYLKKLYDNAEIIYKATCRPYSGLTTSSVDIRNRDPSKKVPKRKGKKEIEQCWQFPEPLYICSMEALSDWVNHDGVRDLYEKEMLLEYSKATLKVKAEWMAKYLEETNAVLFIDDVDMLTGRKLQVVKAMLNVAFRVIYTCKSENAINPSLRIPILESDPQILRLESDTAYDVTPYFLLSIEL